MAQKTVLITGSNRGIGLGLAKHYLNQNYRVISTCRNTAKVPEELSSSPNSIVIPLDVSSQQSIDNAVEMVKKQKIEKIDILLNNAGFAPFDTNGCLETSAEDYKKCFEVNSLGPILITKAFLPLLKNSPGAKVINMTSQMGSIAVTDHSTLVPYRVSKAALNMITKCMSIELQPHKITVISMHPGWVDTDMGNHSKVKPPTSVKESVDGMVDIIDKIPQSESGRFVNFRNEIISW